MMGLLILTSVVLLLMFAKVSRTYGRTIMGQSDGTLAAGFGMGWSLVAVALAIASIVLTLLAYPTVGSFGVFAEAVWFFMPILAANQVPGIAKKFGFAGNPVSVRWLGESKTWAGYYLCPIVGVGAIYLQRHFPDLNAAYGLINYDRHDLWLIGALGGLGAILGDHLESFLKRRCEIPAGESAWPFDQIDFLLGGLLIVAPVTGFIGWDHVLILVWVMIMFVHPIGNLFGFYILKIPRKHIW